jgi:hypothetical protein
MDDDQVRVLAGVVGVLLLLITIGSVLRTLIVPRGTKSILIHTLSQCTRRILLGMALPKHTYEARDRLLAWLAPLVLVETLLCWLFALFVGYGLLLYSFSSLAFAEALRSGGSSLLTPDFSTSAHGALTVVDFAAAATGPLVVALQIAYLPTLYDAYNRREIEVTLLRSRAGEPPWGPELLARHALVGTIDELSGFFVSWERLASDMGESHANYPVLMLFRSPRPYRSWIVSLLTVMDGAALLMALAPSSQPAAPARIMVRAGFTALRDIARVARIKFNSDPLPEDPIDLTYEDFENAVAVMKQAGFPTERSTRDAWAHFRGWRVNYEHIVYELARQVDAVPAYWSGPRDWSTEPMPPRRPTDRRPQTP